MDAPLLISRAAVTRRVVTNIVVFTSLFFLFFANSFITFASTYINTNNYYPTALYKSFDIQFSNKNKFFFLYGRKNSKNRKKLPRVNRWFSQRATPSFIPMLQSQRKNIIYIIYYYPPPADNLSKKYDLHHRTKEIQQHQQMHSNKDEALL